MLPPAINIGGLIRRLFHHVDPQIAGNDVTSCCSSAGFLGGILFLRPPNLAGFSVCFYSSVLLGFQLFMERRGGFYQTLGDDDPRNPLALLPRPHTPPEKCPVFVASSHSACGSQSRHYEGGKTGRRRPTNEWLDSPA